MARSQKELAIFLSRLKPFKRADRTLEQYPTDSNIAARMLWTAHLEGALKDSVVIDLGCGTGILGIGALIMGARKVIMVDTDASVKETLRENLEMLQKEYVIEPEEMVDIVTNDVRFFRTDEKKEECTVLMNPPFGTSITHADTVFLETAFRSGSHIYTMHKTSTKEHIRKETRKRSGLIVWEEDVQFMIKNTMKEHRKHIQRIDVTMFHLVNE
ncbi:MAG: METTL5 family protein [Candidatus Woesearchaeota archaeon]